MGITARGAWEAVKRHFREMDVDIQRDAVHGRRRRRHVGRRVRQRHAAVAGRSGSSPPSTIATSSSIPTPIRQRSSAERKRLFDLPRSSWQDYDKALISAGGGVFSRSAQVDPAVAARSRALLGLDEDRGDAGRGDAARSSRRQVDLLWFGGIGTYVRAAERDATTQVGDRANDAIRITGAEVRAKVVGEGANLGVTQRGRIEAARRGVRLNTDAIDNSAGVNTSDVEVNIKIALARPERDGRLDAEARNALLAEMTDEVAAPRAAQQLSADARALARRAARRRRSRLRPRG